MESAAADPPPEILPWLKSLPLAPEFHPTLAEFQDPVSYILKIESQATKFGICKIVPPLHPSSKKTVFSHLNRSFAASHPQKLAVFPTRHQEIGLCPRRSRPALKTVWESGESCTLQQFEAKSKQFERTHLKRRTKTGQLGLEIETLFWKATADRPFTVECASDIPGSGFAPVSAKRLRESGEEALTVADTAWNMRVVSRAKGSLLKFLEEEVLGVTSPRVDVGMAFNWFAWHVEDHDLHGLNYLHIGAEKTWYGVPMDAAAAFEEVVRVHGYGGEVNPLVTFATLCDKTTVMSPEVLTEAGVPCCRLVQNAGEFVVTFPRAYHSGFSHGFNCGEVANIATPEWLKIAKEAAIRRASINYPPLGSHIQLLYALALTFCSRIPMGIINEPRSSRLKDKKRGEGDAMVKGLFVQNVIKNHDLLHALLEKGSSCVLLPQNYSEMNLCSHLCAGFEVKAKASLPLGLCSFKDSTKGSKFLSDDMMLNRGSQLRHSNGFCSMKGKPLSTCQEVKRPIVKYRRRGGNGLHASTSGISNVDGGKEARSQGVFSDHLRFPCVSCGLLSFPCVAIIQPREAAARHLMFADSSSFDQIVGPGVSDDLNNVAGPTGWMHKDSKDCLERIHAQSDKYKVQVADERVALASDSVTFGISSLDLLAFAYGDPSDSEEEVIRPNTSVSSDDFSFAPNCSVSGDVLGLGTDRHPPFAGWSSKSKNSTLNEPSDHTNRIRRKKSESTVASTEVLCLADVVCRKPDGCSRTSIGAAKENNCDVHKDNREFDSADLSASYDSPSQCMSDTTAGRFMERTQFGNMVMPVKNPQNITWRSDNDASRMHVFCLEHATDVAKHLHPIGGVHVLLLCHPDYPKIEDDAKALAEELGIDNLWKDIPFSEADQDVSDMIRSALDYQQAIPGNSDWAVKLGVNLYYSASLSKSPLYSKQMPHNSVMCKAFGLHSMGNSLSPKVSRRRPGKQKKIYVAGRWCGKVWMSNQVHPYLAYRDSQEQANGKSCFQDLKEKLKFDGDIIPGEQMMLPKRSSFADETVERKSGKKRSKSLEKMSPKKPRWVQSSDTFKSIDDLPENPSPQCGRVLRSRLVKNGTPLRLDDHKKSIGRTYLNSKVKSDRGLSMRLRKRPLKRQEPKVNQESAEIKVKCVVQMRTTGERQVRKKNSEKARSTKKVRLEKDEAEYQCKRRSISKRQVEKKQSKKATSSKNIRVKKDETKYQCDIDGCSMRFSTKRDLTMHKRNICLVKGCGKKLFSHKYMLQHQRVHIDSRPLKCPWNGCQMTFKWAWARTEHMRVHTGARPYQCAEEGCGQTFRFVSDFSRHKRKTGHSVKKKKRIRG